MKLIVDKIIDETPEIRSFHVKKANGEALPAYEPGAHIDVTGPSGIMRQYSLCGPLDDLTGYTFAVKKEINSRGGSRALHDDVTVGSELEIGEPRNLFALEANADAYILVGAGIGITPLLSMAYRLHAKNADFTVHYFTRSPEHTAFMSLMKASPFADHIVFHHGVHTAEMNTALSSILTVTNAHAQVYTCGPEGFMEAVVTVAAQTRPEELIHLEHFQAAEPVANAETDGEFKVQLASTGQVFTIPANIPIMDVLIKEGIAIDSSCKEGICGTCIIPVLEGEPDHRDNCLSKKEKAANDQICTCVSRAKSATLVLDL